MAATLIDPTIAGKYPVILGEGLLEKTSNDIFTGVRYNHKPALSSGDAPNTARLKPSIPGKTDSYDLTFFDDNESYAYAGSRDTNGNQYVLHFDPERKAFILDKIDSTFSMNITRVPGNSDPESLRRQYPHLDSQPGPPKRVAAKKTSAPKDKDTAKSQAAKESIKRKPEKKQQSKEVALSFPEPAKENPKKPVQRTTFENEDEDEDDDDDDDGGLLIEYPGAETAAAANQTDFSPAFPRPRRFDDFMDQRDSEADDADGESDDEPDMDFKLPSPVNHHSASRQDHVQDDEEDDEGQEMQQVGGAEMSDMEDDLAKDMELAFAEGMADTPGGDGGGGDESEISEED
ncbi:Transcription elognation factor Eaf [Moelleriella libera RCEF 2490]|uniref:Transcription elognation factor Eaf n=1 Tax=Moelleriella libera RCEF 2490 TaxID=1081109 RepID=A0A167XTS6_9HYPO|nr:Transcription elognation factor Eaf [Moelleriella libera RCEF 2490]